MREMALLTVDAEGDQSDAEQKGRDHDKIRLGEPRRQPKGAKEDGEDGRGATHGRDCSADDTRCDQGAVLHDLNSVALTDSPRWSLPR